MATKKKSQKKKVTARSKSATRSKNSKSAADKSSKHSVKARSTKSATKKSAAKSAAKGSPTKTAPKTVSTKNSSKKSTKRSTPRETPRVFRSSLPTRGESGSLESDNVDPRGTGARSGGQSGDLQGLSDMESADSESVGELLEEGNAFEAEVVKGVQDAPDADESEVQTHQGRDEDDTGEDYREN